MFGVMAIFLGIVQQGSVLKKIIALFAAGFATFPALVILSDIISRQSLLLNSLSAFVVVVVAIYWTCQQIGTYIRRGVMMQKHLLYLKEFMKRVKKDETERRLKNGPLYLDKTVPYALLFWLNKHCLKRYNEIHTAYPGWYYGKFSIMSDFFYGVQSAATQSASSRENFFGAGDGSGSGSR